MASKIPATLKPLTPFMRRAEEIEKTNDPKNLMVAYFCRSYAMDLGLSLNDQSPAVESFLGDLIQTLEATKKHLPPYKIEEAKELCETFGLEVFKKADDEDRAGYASKSTARAFYAASTFLEMTKQFNSDKELPPDLKQSVVYSKWKATDILSALKRGEKPHPGPPGGDDDDDDNDMGGGPLGGGGGGGFAESDLPPMAPTSKVEFSVPDVPEFNFSSGPASPGSDSMMPESWSDPSPSRHDNFAVGTVASESEEEEESPPPSPKVKKSNRKKKSSKHPGSTKKQRTADALEYAQFAVRAIQTDELELAIRRLQDAIDVLES